jgi:hypothetical protein
MILKNIIVTNFNLRYKPSVERIHVKIAIKRTLIVTQTNGGSLSHVTKSWYTLKWVSKLVYTPRIVVDVVITEVQKPISLTSIIKTRAPVYNAIVRINPPISFIITTVSSKKPKQT